MSVIPVRHFVPVIFVQRSLPIVLACRGLLHLGKLKGYRNIQERLRKPTQRPDQLDQRRPWISKTNGRLPFLSKVFNNAQRKNGWIKFNEQLIF